MRKTLMMIGVLVVAADVTLGQPAQMPSEDGLPGFVIGTRANEPCPADAITGQIPSACGTTRWFFYDDLEFCTGTLCSRVRCEDFPKTGLLDPNDPNDAIGTIRWSGVYIDPNSNGCTKAQHQFRVRFYPGSYNGVPDPNFVYSEDVLATAVDTGETVLFAFATIPAIRWMFTAELTTPQHRAQGWFAVTGMGTPGCFFLWEGSDNGGDHKMYGWFEQGGTIPGPPITNTCDLNYCFGVYVPVHLGACCDECAQTCVENVPEAACDPTVGRFHPGQSCDSFGDPNDPNNPPCGEALGACCHDDGTCDQTLCRDCPGATPPVCRGDFNCDGAVTFDDINPFVDALGGAPCCDPSGENCDVNSDGQLNFDDIPAFIDRLGQPCSSRSGRSDSWLGPFTSCDDCCSLDCNSPTHIEQEPCGTEINGGCNELADPNDPNSPVDPNGWEHLGVLDPNHPTVVCGTLWADNGTRDTDWYDFQLPVRGTLAWVAQTESIPLLTTPVFGDGDLTPPSIPANCHGGPIWGYWNAPPALPCLPSVMAPTDVFPANVTYWWIAFPDDGNAIFYGYPCTATESEYRITITTTPFVCDPCQQADQQEAEPGCGLDYVDAFNAGCDAASGFPVQTQLDPSVFYCGKSGTWVDPNGNAEVDYDWWKIVLTGTVNKRLRIDAQAAFNLRYELYSVPGGVCANKIRRDYYEIGSCESNVSIYTACLPANGAMYYVRFMPIDAVDCAQHNTYRFLYSVVTEAPACTICNLSCTASPDDVCQVDPNGVETNAGCDAADPNNPANYMTFTAGDNTYGPKYCGRLSTFTGSDGTPRADLDWFRYLQLPGRTKLVIRAKAMFRMSVNIWHGCDDPNKITHGWDRPCKGTTTAATQTYTGLTPDTVYNGVILYGNGGGDGTGEQPLKQFFLGLPCTDNRNTYELELQAQT